MYQISVSKEDIQNGERFSSTSCPIAKAIKRKVEWCTVDDECVIIEETPGGKLSQYDLPLIAKEFVNSFDNGRAVKPFTFHLK